MERAELAALAQETVRQEERRFGGALPAGVRMVVVVTDESGAFVGVGANTTLHDAWNILDCALRAEDRVDHQSEAR